MNKRFDELCLDVFSEATHSDGIVRNVVLLGPCSQNKDNGKQRRYSERAMSDACRLAEGAQLYIDHPAPTAGHRSVRDFLGVAHNARIEAGKVRADIAVQPEHRQLIEFLLEHKPARLGFSGVFCGKRRETKTEMIVEEITEAPSWDLVTRAATVTSLFESKQEEATTMEWKDITVEALRENRPDLVTKLEGPFTEQVSTSATQIAAMQQELDQLRAAEAARKRADFITESISKSKLNELPQEIKCHALSGTFMESLKSMPEEQITAAIAEREAAIMAVTAAKPTSAPKQTGDHNPTGIMHL